ncbi:MFS transporter [Paenibacillus sp. J2TS4]|uniref:MFS transporter n=1 Tax=Paenibacillus sp. J2TS4 TaxID=2807194 RepID=UPI001B23847B|nr:MFS transporter [Paenibacillus sp. J2TS4]GIP34348.1 MFS transporter [Paenibacillus sp. J2TS4]
MNPTIPLSGPGGHRPVTIIAIVTALCLLGDSMLYIVLPIYWREIGLDALWQVGVLLSINRFVRLPLNPFIGWLYNKMSLRTGIFAAVLLSSVTMMGYGLWKGFVVWLVLRSVWGLAWSLLRMGGYFTVINYSDDTNRGRLMGRYNGLSRLGSLFGMLLGGVLTPIIGIQGISIAFGVVALTSLPLVFLSIPHSISESEPSRRRSPKEPGSIWTGAVIRVILAGLGLSLLWTVLGSTLSLLIDSNYPQPYIFGFIMTSTALAGVLQAIRWVWEPFLASWIGRRSDGPKGRLPMFIFALLASAAGYALVPWPMPLFLWCFVILFVMMCGTAITTLMDALASDAARATSVIAVMTAYSVATDLGAALGPMLVYLFANLNHGLFYTYLGSALCFLLIALSYRPLLSRQSQSVPSRMNFPR